MTKYTIIPDGLNAYGVEVVSPDRLLSVRGFATEREAAAWIADPLKAGPLEDVDLWPVWDAVRCPTLLLRGETSDVISREVAEAMTRRGPKAKLVEFPGIGHAPPLVSDDQIGAVRDFLLG